MTGTDTITFLCARGRRLAKLVRSYGAVVGFQGSKYFDLSEHPLADLDDLGEALAWLLPRPDHAIVRGAVADPARVLGVRRLVHPCPHTGEAPTLREAPRRWLALDLDGLPLPPGGDVRDLAYCGAQARAALPTAFHTARGWVAASASHSFKSGMRLRFWFWLERPLSGPECRHWLRDAPVDPALFSPAQLTYTAGPLFDGGAADPLPCRLLPLPGTQSFVTPPAPAALAPAPLRPLPTPHQTGAGAYALAALAGAARRVSGAPEQTRHPTLLREARRLARMVSAGLLGAWEVRQTLERAARDCSLPDKEAEKVIGWALLHPSTSPLPAGVQ